MCLKSKRDSGILRRFAWGMGKPMTIATIELLEYLPHIVDKKAVCGKCKECGDNNIFHLDFHHINGDKEFTISRIKTYWLRL